MMLFVPKSKDHAEANDNEKKYISKDPSMSEPVLGANAENRMT